MSKATLDFFENYKREIFVILIIVILLISYSVDAREIRLTPLVVGGGGACDETEKAWKGGIITWLTEEMGFEKVEKVDLHRGLVYTEIIANEWLQGSYKGSADFYINYFQSELRQRSIDVVGCDTRITIDYQNFGLVWVLDEDERKIVELDGKIHDKWSEISGLPPSD